MEKIYYSYINSPIGTICAATTKKSLCQVHLSSSARAMTLETYIPSNIKTDLDEFNEGSRRH